MTRLPAREAPEAALELRCAFAFFLGAACSCSSSDSRNVGASAAVRCTSSSSASTATRASSRSVSRCLDASTRAWGSSSSFLCALCGHCFAGTRAPSWPTNKGALSNLDASATLETLNTGLSKPSSWSYPSPTCAHSAAAIAVASTMRSARVTAG